MSHRTSPEQVTNVEFVSLPVGRLTQLGKPTQSHATAVAIHRDGSSPRGLTARFHAWPCQRHIISQWPHATLLPATNHSKGWLHQGKHRQHQTASADHMHQHIIHVHDHGTILYHDVSRPFLNTCNGSQGSRPILSTARLLEPTDALKPVAIPILQI